MRMSAAGIGDGVWNGGPAWRNVMSQLEAARISAGNLVKSKGVLSYQDFAMANRVTDCNKDVATDSRGPRPRVREGRARASDLPSPAEYMDV